MENKILTLISTWRKSSRYMLTTTANWSRGQTSPDHHLVTWLPSNVKEIISYTTCPLINSKFLFQSGLIIGWSSVVKVDQFFKVYYICSSRAIFNFWVWGRVERGYWEREPLESVIRKKLTCSTQFKWFFLFESLVFT